ncbi:MAG: hypothetical protein FJW77_09695 [Actinobacteria bacterium]|nr:hypothetical protein [Actinomycetota bacterium]
MRVAHLVRRFVRTLGRGEPGPVDRAWVAQVCTPCEAALWRRLPRHDRRHAVTVARAVEARLAGTAFADDPRWIEAALLHDVGKLDAGLGVPGRVVATVLAAIGGPARIAGWAPRSGYRGRIGRYLDHPDRGAVQIRRCGGSPEAAAWAAAHQEPARHAACGLPGPVVDALCAADDD